MAAARASAKQPARPAVPAWTRSGSRSTIASRIVTSKLVSIITPTFNAGAKLAATITSVAGQDRSLFDYRIVDGGSTDDTLDVIRRHAPDVELISERDAGVYDAINKGIVRSTGRFLYILGAGDVMRPSILASIADRLAAAPPNSIVYGDVYWVGLDRLYDARFSKRDLTVRCVCHQATFIDRSLFALHGMYDLRYPISADWHFNIRCFCDPRVQIQYVDAVIADYEGGGISDTGHDAQFQSDLPGLIRRSFGIRYWLLLWLDRMRRRTRGILLALKSRL